MATMVDTLLHFIVLHSMLLPHAAIGEDLKVPTGLVKAAAMGDRRSYRYVDQNFLVLSSLSNESRHRSDEDVLKDAGADMTAINSNQFGQCSTRVKKTC